MLSSQPSALAHPGPIEPAVAALQLVVKVLVGGRAWVGRLQQRRRAAVIACRSHVLARRSRVVYNPSPAITRVE